MPRIHILVLALKAPEFISIYFKLHAQQPDTIAAKPPPKVTMISDGPDNITNGIAVAHSPVTQDITAYFHPPSVRPTISHISAHVQACVTSAWVTELIVFVLAPKVNEQNHNIFALRSWLCWRS